MDTARSDVGRDDCDLDNGFRCEEPISGEEIIVGGGDYNQPTWFTSTYLVHQ